MFARFTKIFLIIACASAFAQLDPAKNVLRREQFEGAGGYSAGGWDVNAQGQMRVQSITVAGGTGTDADDLSDNVINDLSNVNASPSLDLDVMVWRTGTSKWESVPASTIAGAQDIDDLGDVTITTPATDSILEYNGSIWIDAVRHVFSTFAVSGQTDVVADSKSDTLTFVAGAGIDITTSGDSITIGTEEAGVYTAGTGISIDTNVINHSNSVSAYSGTTPKRVTWDAQGHVTGSADIALEDISNILDLGLDQDGMVLEYTSVLGPGWEPYFRPIFSTITVSGQSNVVADSRNDSLALASGTGIAITTDPVNDIVTITSTGSGAGTLEDLADTNITSPENRDVLLYSTATSKWIDSSLLGLEDLTDPGADHVLYWNDSLGRAYWYDLASFLLESEIDTEAELETFLTDVTDVYTNNDTEVTLDTEWDTSGEIQAILGDVILEAELDTEAELEAQLTDVTNVFTNNDSIPDANVSDTLTASIYKGSGSTTNEVDLATNEAAGTLPWAKITTIPEENVPYYSPGGWSYADPIIETELDTEAELESQIGVGLYSVGEDIASTDIGNDTVALGTKTTGNYVASVADGTGIDITGSAGEGWTATANLDFSAALTGDHSLSANQWKPGVNGLIFEGATADTIELYMTLADPASTDKTITIPAITGTLITTGDTATVTKTMINTAADTDTEWIFGRSQIGYSSAFGSDTAVFGHTDMGGWSPAIRQTSSGDTTIGGATITITNGFDMTGTDANEILAVDASGNNITPTSAINGVTIGGTTPAAGAFTTLSATSTVTATGGTFNIGVYDTNEGHLALFGDNNLTGGYIDMYNASGTDTAVDRWIMEALYNDGAYSIRTAGGSLGTREAFKIDDVTLNAYFYGDVVVDGDEIGPSEDTDLIGLGNGALTVRGSLTATGTGLFSGGGVGSGTAGTTRGFFTAFRGSGSNTPGYLCLYALDGTPYYIFVESDGTVKVHTAAPSADADGSAIGDQTD